MSEFFNDRRARDGKTSYCKPCMTRRNAESKARRACGERVTDRRPRRAPLVERVDRRCPACGETKPLEAFVANRRGTDGYGAYCRPCHNRITRENRTKNHGSTRDYHLFARYGVTASEVAAMVAAQDGTCAICRVRPAEHVDHDHATGAVRGVLCFTCNVGLGSFNDEPERLRLAHDYLFRTPGADTAARVRRILGRAS